MRGRPKRTIEYKTSEAQRAQALGRYYKMRDAFLGFQAAEEIATGNIKAHKDFWAGAVIGPTNACWEWYRGRGKKGYGLVEVAGKRTGAHRVAWEITRMWQLPVGAIVMHTCDNPPCINPSHLRKATTRENTQDMYQKGRHGCRKGEKNPKAKLTAEKVKEIKELHASGGSLHFIAKSFGISESHTWNIVVGRFWKHL